MSDAASSVPIATLGLLRPAEGATQLDLDQALRDVQAAVGSGQAEGSFLSFLHVGSPSAQPTPISSGLHIRQAAIAPFSRRPAREARVEREEILVNVRSFPFAARNPLAPDWSHGMRASTSRGPFVNGFGQRFWIDTYTLPLWVTIEARAGLLGGPKVLARLPLAPLHVLGDTQSLRAGSAWLAAQTLDPSRPANEFVGVRIRGGTVRIASVTANSGSTITLQDDWTLQVELQLDPPANPQPENGPGADGSHAAITLPATVRITLAAARAPSMNLDDSGATAYGSSIGLRRTARSPFYDALSRSIVVPCGASQPAFVFADVRSDTFEIAQSAAIEKSGWALPVAVTSADALGDAEGAGAVWLQLSGRLRARWNGLADHAKLSGAILLLSPGSLSVLASLAPGEVRQTLRLWDEKRSASPRQSAIDITSATNSVVLHVSRPGTETVLVGGNAKPHLDRPVQADGGRMSASFAVAWLLITTNAEGQTAAVIAAEPKALSVPHIAFAIENALLKTRPPAWLYAFGSLQGDQLESGTLLLRFPLRTLLPTLPDPYAANVDFRRSDVDTGWVTATVSWSAPAASALGFSLQGAEPIAGIVEQAATFMIRGTAQRAGACVLLDVSSNADQFGIAIPIAARSTNIQGLSVVVQAGETPVITLPPISWEPMLTKAPASTSGDIVLPPPPNDGGPAAVMSELQDMRPANPISLLSAHFAAIRENNHFLARLPLPFGLVAMLKTRDELPPEPRSKFISRGASVYMNRPVFPGGLTGALQLALRAAPRAPESATQAGFIDQAMPGQIEFAGDYAKAVLSTNIYTQFDLEFGPSSSKPGIEPRIPLRHYELSGYAVSLLSDWRNTRAVGPAIIQARFDVLVGRTAHEVIQMQSVLYPWFVRITRTILIDRMPGGWVLREDNGWVAASAGLFDYPPPVAEAFTPAQRHMGTITGIERVRNIRLDGAQFPIPVLGGMNSIQWQPVRFDADVMFLAGAAPRLVVAGGSASGRVPSREITGWIQIGGPTYDDFVNGNKIALTRPDLQPLHDHGAVQGTHRVHAAPGGIGFRSRHDVPGEQRRCQL